jgi:hypothetical protein
MAQCDWCKAEGIVYHVEMLMRGVVMRIAHLRLCRYCLSQAED